ncbi:hypothetical protein KJ611_03150 [Patescibacteria group bacterium]|nr:hypothetical protein [Patescibacteria group bacterium]MBU1705512.1 hypothetical protein [Patescibacteria group bacterium]
MLDRLIFRHQNKRERQASCLLVVIGLIIISVFLIQITDFKIKPPTAPLLPPSSSLVQASDLAQAQNQTDTRIFIPEELFGSTLHTIGIYHQAVGNLPAESVVVVLKKDDWRFAEITQRPGRSLAQELTEQTRFSQTPIQLGPLAGVLIETDPDFEHCLDPQADGTPGFCLLTHKIIFEMAGQLFTVAGSEPSITPGELISLSRSIVAQGSPPIDADDSPPTIDETILE